MAEHPAPLGFQDLCIAIGELYLDVWVLRGSLRAANERMKKLSEQLGEKDKKEAETD